MSSMLRDNPREHPANAHHMFKWIGLQSERRFVRFPDPKPSAGLWFKTNTLNEQAANKDHGVGANFEDSKLQCDEIR